MNNRKPNPTGVDKPIDALQLKLYKEFSSLGVIKGFPRVYIGPHKDQGYVLQHYLGEGEYEDVLRNDDSRFFFYLNPEINVSDQNSAKVGIVFMVDLSDLTDDDTRRDEFLRNRALDVVNRSSFKPSTIKTGLNHLKSIMGRVYTMNSRSRDVFYSTNFELDDMHPFHVFTIECDINYSYKNC